MRSWGWALAGVMACSTPTASTGGTSGGFILQDVGGGGSTGSTCVPNDTKECLCVGGSKGVQSCLDTGKAWTKCDCGTGGGTGGNDGSASDGSTTDGSTVADAGGSTKDTGSTIDDTGSTTPDDTGSGASDTADFGDFFDNPSDDTGNTGGGGGGKDVGGGGGGGGGGGDGGGVASDCVDRAKIIYLVSKENVLLNFNPDTKTIKKIGVLNCPVAGTPFSMAVDRQANAYVLYQSSMGTSGAGMFKVSTLDASCQKTAYIPNSKGLQVFGMAFSANSVGSNDETLFIAGEAALSFQMVKNTLATIDPSNMIVNPITKFPSIGGADLTGNGLGELYGFFPEPTPSVKQIDKTNATFLKNWPLSPQVYGGIMAWAFAQWGGNLYLFYWNGNSPTSDIGQLNTASGVATTFMKDIGYTIVGAGVSSCAPTGEP